LFPISGGIVILRRTIILSFFVLLCGCTVLSPTSPASTASSSVSPSPATSEQINTEQPAKRGNTGGIITGVLLDEESEPISDLGVFLADLTDGPEGESKIITFQLGSSKRGVTDAQGRFIIEDVMPASYSLAIWTPSQSVLIPEPGSTDGNAILVEVETGKTVDVGMLKIKRPD
jgi:hypothetical protein